MCVDADSSVGYIRTLWILAGKLCDFGSMFIVSFFYLRDGAIASVEITRSFSIRSRAQK